MQPAQNARPIAAWTGTRPAPSTRTMRVPDLLPSGSDQHHAARRGDFVATQRHPAQGDCAARPQDHRAVAVRMNRSATDRASGQTVVGPLLAICEDAMIRIVRVSAVLYNLR